MMPIDPAYHPLVILPTCLTLAKPLMQDVLLCTLSLTTFQWLLDLRWGGPPWGAVRGRLGRRGPMLGERMLPPS